MEHVEAQRAREAADRLARQGKLRKEPPPTTTTVGVWADDAARARTDKFEQQVEEMLLEEQVRSRDARACRQAARDACMLPGHAMQVAVA